ncbi:MAG: putative zinc-binding protein [Caldisphaeraceae archaeon]|nr:putative zinc-binding protein [Caldisphaeraceae archaeon]MEB3691918.1 putative zinc-binding protein [Caldisphaeraceae archaeon]
MVTSQYKYSLLPSCSKYAPNLIIVATCDGASSTGQVGNEVARILTKSYPSLVRMCCLAAVAAESELHSKIFHDAKAVIAINGCPLKCTSRILRSKGIEPAYEVTITELGVPKVSTLDFDEETARRIARRIADGFIKRFQEKEQEGSAE